MRYDVFDLHKAELFTIIDASIPNKAQNSALRGLISATVDTLMNRVADGWLDDGPVAAEQTKGVENNGGSIVTTGPVTTLTVPLTIVP